MCAIYPAHRLVHDDPNNRFPLFLLIRRQCISNVPQTIDNYQNNTDIMNRSSAQTFRESGSNVILCITLKCAHETFNKH